jgi:hypothetical protein
MSERADFVRGYLESLPHDIKDVYRDDAIRDALIDRFRPRVAEGFQISLVGPPGSGFEDRYEGIDGFVEGWRQWTDPYESYLFEFEGLEEIGNIVLANGRQTATLPGGTEAIDMPKITSVWQFDSGRVISVEFHLDRDLAYDRARRRNVTSGSET